jgi:hypothetical protein
MTEGSKLFISKGSKLLNSMFKGMAEASKLFDSVAKLGRQVFNSMAKLGRRAVQLGGQAWPLS